MLLNFIGTALFIFTAFFFLALFESRIQITLFAPLTEITEAQKDFLHFV